MSRPQLTFTGKKRPEPSLFSFLLNYKLHRLAVKAPPNPWACGNLGISTRARLSQSLLYSGGAGGDFTTKDKGEAGGGARSESAGVDGSPRVAGGSLISNRGPLPRPTLGAPSRAQRVRDAPPPRRLPRSSETSPRGTQLPAPGVDGLGRPGLSRPLRPTRPRSRGRSRPPNSGGADPVQELGGAARSAQRGDPRGSGRPLDPAARPAALRGRVRPRPPGETFGAKAALG